MASSSNPILEVSADSDQYNRARAQHNERADRKEEERSQKRQKGPKYGSATESDSQVDSDAGFEYPLEEINTTEEDSDAVEDKQKMQRYLDWKLRRRAAPEASSSESDEDLPEVSSDEGDEEDSDDESSSSGDDDTSPAPSGNSCSKRYEEDEDWSYDEEEF
ncbi:histone deacetylase HDT1-like [Papaver somniferum]|uniref:histone deacetylase HDT1-like n=1 Tax=Papaver somniferum TaxID=3469 RepID=UPI000E6F5EF5|nr:histone deacetylase HDT1-like [Papaver somniferum]